MIAMLADAPRFLLAIEEGLGAAIRQSAWAYPAANVGHILALTLFAGAVAVLDLRLLGVLGGAPTRAGVTPVRRAAAGAFGLMLATGFVLFAAEASHVAANRVFQVKMLLVLAALVNAAVSGRLLQQLWAAPDVREPPPALRACACLSIALWLGVATCGRLIAYF